MRQRYSITTQLLILYYILSYEESLLASTKQLGRYQGPATLFAPQVQLLLLVGLRLLDFLNISCFNMCVTLPSSFSKALMQKKPKSYSATLMDQIPIKHLVTQAQGLQQELGGEAAFLLVH